MMFVTGVAAAAAAAAATAATAAAPSGASSSSSAVLQPTSASTSASAGADVAMRPTALLSDPNSSLAWREATTSLNSLATSADADLPLVSHIWTADPAGHVFDGNLWVYTSHDQDKRPRGAADGADQFNMRDYRAFSFADPTSKGRDEGVILSLEDVPWASQQLWAPDVTRDAHGVYHLFFPAKDSEERFRIGHAQASHPQGPFVADETPLAGSLSIDPAVFVDDDEGDQPNQAFLLFGGLWGGQLESLRNETDGEHAPIHPTRCALAPLMAPLAADMKSFVVPPRLVVSHGPIDPPPPPLHY